MVTLRSILGLMRDLVKTLYLYSLQIRTRLFYIEREWPSSISYSAVLDVIPRRSNQKLNKLLMRRKSNIEKWCVVNTWHGSVILGENSGIGIGSIVLGPVTIGDNCSISQNCFISGQSHRYDNISKNLSEQGLDVKEVVIEEHVWVGSNCVILRGVRIGKNSVIGAGSVVAKDIPPFSVAVGNPARTIKRYNFERGQWQQV